MSAFSRQRGGADDPGPDVCGNLHHAAGRCHQPQHAPAPSRPASPHRSSSAWTTQSGPAADDVMPVAHAPTHQHSSWQRRQTCCKQTACRARQAAPSQQASSKITLCLASTVVLAGSLAGLRPPGSCRSSVLLIMTYQPGGSACGVLAVHTQQHSYTVAACAHASSPGTAHSTGDMSVGAGAARTAPHLQQHCCRRL